MEETMQKSNINLNEYNNYDAVDILFNDGAQKHYDDVAEFTWNDAKDVAAIVNSVGTVDYVNMYAVTIMTRYRCGGTPYTVQ